MSAQLITEPREAKTTLKILVAVISKGGLTSTSPTKPSFGMTATIITKSKYKDNRVEFYSLCLTKRRLR